MKTLNQTRDLNGAGDVTRIWQIWQSDIAQLTIWVATDRGLINTPPNNIVHRSLRP